MKSEKGNWQVVRNCCTSGMCLNCRTEKTRPARVVHASGYSEEYARYVAGNWRSYGAKAEPMSNA
jgi:hypothetical protein